jgi:hypothetical protein
MIRNLRGPNAMKRRLKAKMVQKRMRRKILKRRIPINDL